MSFLSGVFISRMLVTYQASLNSPRSEGGDAAIPPPCSSGGDGGVQRPPAVPADSALDLDDCDSVDSINTK